MSDTPCFGDFFHGLWGKEPFKWQDMLAARVREEQWPDVIDLPTASGKTACLDIAVWALAAQADKPLVQRTAPRRIWFVVDRRIVVEEAYQRAQKLAEKLACSLKVSRSNDPVRSVAERLLKLRGLPSRERPLAVARLHGGTLVDDSWASVPSQSAVICSTVDQVGSALLFRAYRHGILSAPIYAGLAANDSLILLDEAHCAVPFLQTARALRKFRGEAWCEAPNPTPFHVALLSATPPQAVDDDLLVVFPSSEERAQALDHPGLQRRLTTSKRAELSEPVEDEAQLVEALACRAQQLATSGHSRVGVIVNRVGRAQKVAQKLMDVAQPPTASEPTFDVHVLTGRIRPFERDLLIAPGTQLHRWFRAHQPETPPRPQILVATQCLEVGADFSFDALVTECASLDALRQRFGRLARLGLPAGQVAPASILTANSCLKESAEGDDPVYGQALKNTWEFLNRIATTVESAATDEPSTGKQRRKSSQAAPPRIVDFGVNALASQLPGDDEVLKLLAPTSDAPILLPAHLDLLSQTAPRPHPEPDISLFLHGKNRGVAQAHVVWRCDLPADRPELWPEIVSLCRPVTGELLPVPLWRLRQWLANPATPDTSTDVEGPAAADQSTPLHTGCRFLVWRGRDRSFVEHDPRRILPDDIVVLPTPEDPAQAKRLGQALCVQGFGHHHLDLWELAWQQAGRPAALRLNRVVLAPWLSLCPPLRELLNLLDTDGWTVQELRDSLAAVAGWQPSLPDAQPLPDWLRQLFGATQDLRLRDCAEHPAGGWLIRARSAPAQADEPDLFADEDEQTARAPDEIPLETHTQQVQTVVAAFAQACLGDAGARAITEAARWHDAGKLDPRFQAFLRGGTPDLNNPLAKSSAATSSGVQARSNRQVARLPENFRHEMLSVLLAERCCTAGLSPEDRELLLHLIASHHGHARPFAPVCEDPDPPDVRGTLAGQTLKLCAAQRTALTPPHRLDSGLADRFWSLTRRYGWWGLAYREAILRLADWYASRHPNAPTSHP
ncbi:MAG: type I-U CRISPR-associated helicase/endonuclease Cas3 [Verrucomicrobiota bacterium]|nr:type I-U CRISPR-associated helicase/endonuclease Cas3 [Limisphaera sp.]MDW8382878.1 type I-U CRISPR-associated helicase/endonuclease Cas3 [Verrucomicrobiota bacterium]